MKKPPRLASGIPVFCTHTRVVASSTLKAHPKGGYRKHPPKQLDRFERVVKGTPKKPGNGYRRSIVVSRRSGFITRGHGLWQMALRRGWDVPIDEQDYANEREEIRDLIADNRLAELAENDDEALARLLSELGEDVELTGFDDAEIERLLRQADEPEGEFPITAKLGERYDYVLIFTTNETDALYLQNLLGVGQEKSYKQSTIGTGRCVPFPRAIAALRAHRHTLDVAGGNDDHASARSKRVAVRAKKPVPGLRGSSRKGSKARRSATGSQ